MFWRVCNKKVFSSLSSHTFDPARKVCFEPNSCPKVKALSPSKSESVHTGLSPTTNLSSARLRMEIILSPSEKSIIFPESEALRIFHYGRKVSSHFGAKSSRIFFSGPGFAFHSMAELNKKAELTKEDLWGTQAKGLKLFEWPEKKINSPTQILPLIYRADSGDKNRKSASKSCTPERCNRSIRKL